MSTIEYEGATRKPYEASTIIDIAEWKSSQQLEITSLCKIAYSKNMLQREIGLLDSSFRCLEVDAYTQDHRDRKMRNCSKCTRMSGANPTKSRSYLLCCKKPPNIQIQKMGAEDQLYTEITTRF